MREFADSLRDKSGAASSLGKTHGAQRWEHGINLREVVDEWNVLQLVVMDKMYRSQDFISITQSALFEAIKRFALFIHKGIRYSLDEFYRLQRREAEEQTQVLEAVIREKDKSSVQRSQNLQEASHDLKGNITALQLNLHLLNQADLSDRARSLVEKLSVAATNQSQLLNNLLDLARLDAGREQLNVSEFDSAQVLKDLSDSMQPVAVAKKLELRYNGVESLKVMGDSTKVWRVAQNLLLNALKYTDEGFVEVSWSVSSPSQWQFTIKDTGPGMDFPYVISQGEDHPEPKQSDELEDEKDTDFPLPSEGIGLLIVRRLCELLDAVIDVESEKGKGTTIRITLPRTYPV